MSADLWGYLGRVSFSAFDLFTFQVSWVERSDTQHIESVSCQPSAIRRAKQVSRLRVAAGLSRVISEVLGSRTRCKIAYMDSSDCTSLFYIKLM